MPELIESLRAYGEALEHHSARSVATPLPELSDDLPGGPARRYHRPALVAVVATLLVALTFTFIAIGRRSSDLELATRTPGTAEPALSTPPGTTAANNDRDVTTTSGAPGELPPTTPTSPPPTSTTATPKSPYSQTPAGPPPAPAPANPAPITTTTSPATTTATAITIPVPTTTGPPPTIDPAALTGHTYTSNLAFESGQQRPILALPTQAPELQLIFYEAGKVGGYAGCNHKGWDFTVTGAQLKTGRGLGTTMLCATLEDQESWFFEIIDAGPTLVLEGDQLILFGGTSVVVFNRTS